MDTTESDQSNNQDTPKLFEGRIRPDHILSIKDVEPTIEHTVLKRLLNIALWVFSFIIAIVFGGIIAVIYDLNGKIYEVAGKHSAHQNIIEIYKDKITEIRNENIMLKNSIEKMKVSLDKKE